MNVIIVGSCVKKEEMIKYPALSVAGNKMLLGFSEGFVSNDCNVDVISVTPRAMRFLKKNGEPLFQKKDSYSSNGVCFNIVSYVNIPFFKQFTIYLSIKKALKKLLKEQKRVACQTVVCVYNTISYFAKPVFKMAKKYNVKTCGIIADLPLKSLKKNLINRKEDERQEKLIKNFDMLIPLTDHIAKDFAPSLPFCRIEAGINPTDFKSSNRSEQEQLIKKVVFSGTLNELSGIELAISSMEYLREKNILLEIYGDGPLREYVQEKSRNNLNIRYCGRVDNATMLAIQKNADLLICPRKSDGYTTKYTFPSKVLEYICSGTPVLTNKLLGIPNEYKDYVYFAEDESPHTWANKMQLLLNDPDSKIYANVSRKAVLKEKNWKEQTRKAKKFIERNL